MKPAAACAMVLSTLLVNPAAFGAADGSEASARMVSYVRLAIGGNAMVPVLQSYGLRLDVPQNDNHPALSLPALDIRPAAGQVLFAGVPLSSRPDGARRFEDEGATDDAGASTAAVVALAVGIAAAAVIVSNVVDEKDEGDSAAADSPGAGSDSGDGGLLGSLPLGFAAAGYRIIENDRREPPAYMGDLLAR